MSTPWLRARRNARAAGLPRPLVRSAPGDAVGAVLADPIVALSDLPPFDAAAMDGWAVAGPGPWTVVGRALAGGSHPEPLADGTAVEIATGAPLPIAAESVLRRERGDVEDTPHGPRLTARGGGPAWGADIRERGSESREGDVLLEAGGVVTPAVAGLAAAAGHDAITVVGTPNVALLVAGDELLERGPARDGRVRDALSPLLPGWVGSLGARAFPPVRVDDTFDALRDAIDDAACDVVITTGSTASGPADRLHDVLADLGADLLVDGVAVRPGHPMLLAALPDGRLLVGLPGNPLAAVSGLLTLAAPLLAAMRGEAGADDGAPAVLGNDVTSHPDDTRLVPVLREVGELVTSVRPLRYTGPAMLRGLALADGMAVIEPGGGRRGSTVTVLPLP